MTVCVFFNDTATTEIYTLSLHDALPILIQDVAAIRSLEEQCYEYLKAAGHEDVYLTTVFHQWRSEEHTSELQSRQYLVCRLLLEQKITSHNCDDPTSAL